MKKLITIIALLICFSTNAQEDSSLGWLFINSNTIALDKQFHAAGGMYLGGSSYLVALGANGGKRSNAKLWGILVPAIVGTLKEWSDAKTTGFDFADLGYTIGGGIVATYTFDFLVQRKKRRR